MRKEVALQNIRQTVGKVIKENKFFFRNDS
jgi:hypothetical protein